MAQRLTIIYDDRAAPPPEIEEIIGASRFSRIRRRRVSLRDEILSQVQGANRFYHLADDRDARHLLEIMEAGAAGSVFMRLPSCLMPTHAGELQTLVEKAPYVLEPMLLSAVEDGEAPLMAFAADMAPLLRQRDGESLRENILSLAQRIDTIPNHAGFVDLRRPSAFLHFMGASSETRHFNNLHLDKHIVKKSSADREKMAGEYGLFHLAPEKMKAYLIPTFDFWDDGQRAGYAMERIAVPDAALQFIHRAFDEKSLKALLDRFFDFLAARGQQKVGVSAVQDEARQAILRKMTRRMDAFMATAQGIKLDGLLVAAGMVGGLRGLEKRAQAVLEAAIAKDGTDYLATGHGDPCFSNILFDRRSQIMRLVDARGARTPDEMWMHPLYDLAKFSHSIAGNYDYINNDLFECALENGLDFKLVLQDGGAPAWCREMFFEQLADAGISLHTVRAFELSLFLSMLPLHVDHPRKLAGFVLNAAQLLTSLETQS